MFLMFRLLSAFISNSVYFSSALTGSWCVLCLIGTDAFLVARCAALLRFLVDVCGGWAYEER